MRAIDKIKELYINESELADLFNIDVKRLRDLRSHHVQGKIEFIDHIKPSQRCVLYRYEDVLEYIENSGLCSFGKNKECQDSD